MDDLSNLMAFLSLPSAYPVKLSTREKDINSRVISTLIGRVKSLIHLFNKLYAIYMTLL